MPETNFVISGYQLKYTWKGRKKPTLSIPEFNVKRGSRTFLKGPSGSGKSTLLGLISGVLPVQSGELCVLNKSLSEMGSKQRDRFRARHFGVVFQQFNLLPYLTVGANVLLPCEFSRKRSEASTTKSGSTTKDGHRLLERLNLPPDQFWTAKTNELSVGQQQRVAVARALIGGPKLIIADEPTSALDTANQKSFIDLLMEEVRSLEASLLFVSHDENLSEGFDEVIDLKTVNKAMEVEAR